MLTSIAANELDGVLALRATLRHGLTAEVLPRQVIIAKVPGNATELSYVHGIPGSTELSAVTFAQDKRMRRSMMEKAGVPIPKGATFSMGHGIKLAKNFIKRIGFPISVKPAIGDNGIEATLNIISIGQFDDALSGLKRPTTERETFTRAAYGLTELREPGVEDGNVTVPPGYMFIVEKQPAGEYLRFLVVSGTVVSALVCDGYPLDGTLQGVTDVLPQVHPDLLALASKAAKVIPGVDVVALDVIVPNFAASPANQNLAFFEYSERPSLWVQLLQSEQASLQIADGILTDYAARLNVGLPAANDQIDCRFEAFALPDAQGGSVSMATAANEHGLTLTIENVDQLEGTVTGEISGDALTAAVFVDALLDGRINDVPVMLARLTSKA